MAMTFDTPGVLTTLQTLVDAIANVKAVGLGAPKANIYDVQAWMVVTAPEYLGKTTGNVIRRRQRVTVVFGYRVGGNVEAAELALAAVNDAFPRAIYHDRTLGDRVGNLEIDGAPAGTAVYAEYAAQEYRVFPQDVIFEQQETIT
jgi:hypothetical protein